MRVCIGLYTVKSVDECSVIGERNFGIRASKERDPVFPMTINPSAEMTSSCSAEPVAQVSIPVQILPPV